MSDCKDYISGRKANVRMKLRERRARTTSAVARRRNSEVNNYLQYIFVSCPILFY